MVSRLSCSRYIFIFSNSATTSPGYTQQTTYVAGNDGNSAPANSPSNPFPNGFLQPVGNSLGALTAIGSTFNFFGQSEAAGVVHQFSADIRRVPRQLQLGVRLFF